VNIFNRFQEKNYLKWNTYTFVGIILIIICGIKVTYNLASFMDVLFWDESLYLTRGVTMFPSIPKDWGPAYSLWYKLLSLFIKDRIALYYFNFQLTTILIAIFFFVFLMSCGIQRVLAFLLSILFLASYINLPLWPRVSHFCILVVLAGIVIAKYQTSKLSKWTIICFVLLIVSYARPELFLSFLFSFCLLIVGFFYKIKSINKKEIGLFGLLLFFLGFMYVFFKTPLNGGDANRSIGVFLQHFAMNYSQWHHDDSIFWLDFPDIVRTNFTDSFSLKAIIQSNPTLFFKHITSNIVHFIEQISKLVFNFFAPIFTKQIHWLCLMVSIILFIIYFSFTNTSSKKRLRFFALIKENFLTLTALFLFSIPPFLVCIYAYPRAHYMLLLVPFLLLLLSLVISSMAVEIENPIQKMTVIAVVCFFTLPVAEDFDYFKMFRKENDLRNLKTLNYIKHNFKTQDSVRVFDLEGGMTNLLPPNFTNYNYIYLGSRKKTRLSSFLLEHKFDIIYHTPTITKLNDVQTDTMLFELLNKPEKYGYNRQKTGNFTATLLIKK